MLYLEIYDHILSRRPDNYSGHYCNLLTSILFSHKILSNWIIKNINPIIYQIKWPENYSFWSKSLSWKNENISCVRPGGAFSWPDALDKPNAYGNWCRMIPLKDVATLSHKISWRNMKSIKLPQLEEVLGTRYNRFFWSTACLCMIELPEYFFLDVNILLKVVCSA